MVDAPHGIEVELLGAALGFRVHYLLIILALIWAWPETP